MSQEDIKDNILSLAKRISELDVNDFSERLLIVLLQGSIRGLLTVLEMEKVE